MAFACLPLREEVVGHPTAGARECPCRGRVEAVSGRTRRQGRAVGPRSRLWDVASLKVVGERSGKLSKVTAWQWQGKAEVQRPQILTPHPLLPILPPSLPAPTLPPHSHNCPLPVLPLLPQTSHTSSSSQGKWWWKMERRKLKCGGDSFLITYSSLNDVYDTWQLSPLDDFQKLFI